MKALADYVHGKGIKLGTYNDMGTQTCGKYPGECKDTQCTLPGYMTVDAKTYRYESTTVRLPPTTPD